MIAAVALLAMLTAAVGLTVKDQTRFFNPPSVYNNFQMTDAKGNAVTLTPNERVEQAFRAIYEDAVRR